MLATFRPVLRAPIATFTHAEDVLEKVAGRYPVLLLVETENDQLIGDLAYDAAALQSAWGIELGNELNFSESAWPFGAFIRRSHETLRDGGFDGRIISGGIGNIERKTLAWLRYAMLVPWPDDVIIGWHAYSEWHLHLADFQALIGDRPHAMTEWGYSLEEWTESAVADMVTLDLETFRQAGAECACYYQIADGPEGPAFGVRTYDYRWRETLNSLKGTPGAPLP